jgi:zinc-finger of the FCS-type, C2-C2
MFHFLVYRGDKAFCSEKCRTEQMLMDESLETVERRQRLRAKSSVSYNRGNHAVRNSSDEQQNKSIFSIQKRPTIANLTACGLISLQNSVYATNTTFMEP